MDTAYGCLSVYQGTSGLEEHAKYTSALDNSNHRMLGSSHGELYQHQAWCGPGSVGRQDLLLSPSLVCLPPEQGEERIERKKFSAEHVGALGVLMPPKTLSVRS